jgi:hypothetical protein
MQRQRQHIPDYLRLTALRSLLLLGTAAALLFCALLSVPCGAPPLHSTDHHAHHHTEPPHPAAGNHCVLHSLVLPGAPAVSPALPLHTRLTLSGPLILGGRVEAPPQPPPQSV